MYLDGDSEMGTRVELRDCTLADLQCYGLFAVDAASVLVEGCTIRGCEICGVMADGKGSRIEVSTQQPTCIECLLQRLVIHVVGLVLRGAADEEGCD